VLGDPVRGEDQGVVDLVAGQRLLEVVQTLLHGADPFLVVVVEVRVHVDDHLHTS
jgi:hypothetical protein